MHATFRNILSVILEFEAFACHLLQQNHLVRFVKLSLLTLRLWCKLHHSTTITSLWCSQPEWCTVEVPRILWWRQSGAASVVLEWPSVWRQWQASHGHRLTASPPPYFLLHSLQWLSACTVWKSSIDRWELGKFFCSLVPMSVRPPAISHLPRWRKADTACIFSRSLAPALSPMYFLNSRGSWRTKDEDAIWQN